MCEYYKYSCNGFIIVVSIPFMMIAILIYISICTVVFLFTPIMTILEFIIKGNISNTKTILNNVLDLPKYIFKCCERKQEDLENYQNNF